MENVTIYEANIESIAQCYEQHFGFYENDAKATDEVLRIAALRDSPIPDNEIEAGLARGRNRCQAR